MKRKAGKIITGKTSPKLINLNTSRFCVLVIQQNHSTNHKLDLTQEKSPLYQATIKVNFTRLQDNIYDIKGIVILNIRKKIHGCDC